MKRTLIVQAGIIAFSVVAVALLASRFPYPSPLIKPFLSPQLRWPTDEVKAWVEAQNFDGDFQTFFARDPERNIPSGADPVAPADGVIQTIALRDSITYFVVGLSFWDVHVVRSPVAGTVKDIQQDGYAFIREAPVDEIRESIFLRGKTAPVQEIVTLETEHGDIKVRLITSYWASRLKLWVRPGQHLSKGERIGRILLGSTVALEFPGEVKFSVPVGRRVVAGETIISEDLAKR